MRLSCLENRGLDILATAIAEELAMSSAILGGHVVAINARHQACLKRAKAALQKSKEGFVDFMGASYSTPSGEGDPASDLVTEYTIEYDSR